MPAPPSGVFALRSPARPNPIGLHVARLVSIDVEAGLLALDAIDALDGTPVIDLKPYFASIDSVAGGDGQVGRTADGRHQSPARHRQGADRAAAAGALHRRGKNPRRRLRAASEDAAAVDRRLAGDCRHVIRHAHTEYEKLLGEGYDRDSARFFVIDEINEVLTRWRATRLLDPDDEEI